MKYIVDRIENDIAVLETDNGYESVALEFLPDNTREGTVLTKVNGFFVADEDAENERRNALFLLQNKLKNKNQKK